MADRFPYAKLAHYPHLMPADVEIWERFIEAVPDAYDSVEYDVKVGNAPEFVEREEVEMHRAQRPLYQRKIDVVGFKGDQIDIIEIGPRAGTNKIGQVVGYRVLYVRDFAPSVTPKAIVLTDDTTDDVLDVAKAQEVFIMVV